MSITTQGYKKNSPYKNRKSLQINSNLITTDGMAFPILAVSDTGDTKFLHPDTGEFQFKGSNVKEYSMKSYQNGGQFDVESYLRSLSPADQDKFVEDYSSAQDKDAFIAKCGGMYQSGGMSKVPQVPGMFQNAEIEKGETVLSPEGILKEAGGKKHSDGGTPVNLDEGSRIFSEFLIAPAEITSQVLGKRTKAKYSFADLSKKFGTEKHFKSLENPDTDKYQRATAEMAINNNMAMLDTIFAGQEMLKEQKSQSRKLKTTYQRGGIIPVQQESTSHISDLGFYQGLPSEHLGTKSKEKLREKKMGGYQSGGEVPASPVPFPGLSYQPKAVNPVPFSGLDPAKVVKQRTHYTPKSNLMINGVPGEFILPEYKTYPKQPLVTPYDLFGNPATQTAPVNTPNPVSVPRKRSALRVKTEKQALGVNSRPTTLQNMPNVFGEDQPMPDMEGLTDGSGLKSLPSFSQDPTIQDLNVPEGSAQDYKTRASDWFAKNKDKFGINSKLAGTILDIGMTASDNLHVSEPPLYNHQKQPLFNRFYEFDNKESQRLASQQIQALQNSNMPEAVKQAQISQVTANSQSGQANVDYANAQRYENKRETDLGKLQTYQDANVDSRISDFDNYRQRKAKVDYLRNKFKSEQKAKIFNSGRNYMDYAEELGVANELSPYFTISPITGKTKIKPSSKSNLQDSLLNQFASKQNNTIDLPNGVTATQIGDFMVVTDKDGKTTTHQIKKEQ